MADELRIDERLAIPPAEIELRASRSSGPGGQHANVTASRVEAVFDVAASRALDEAQRARLLERLRPRPVPQPRTGPRSPGREDRRGAPHPAPSPTDQADRRLPAAPARTEAPRRRAQAGPPPLEPRRLTDEFGSSPRSYG
jgi:hypothetical protein